MSQVPSETNIGTWDKRDFLWTQSQSKLTLTLTLNLNPNIDNLLAAQGGTNYNNKEMQKVVNDNFNIKQLVANASKTKKETIDTVNENIAIQFLHIKDNFSQLAIFPTLMQKRVFSHGESIVKLSLSQFAWLHNTEQYLLTCHCMKRVSMWIE